MPDFERFRFDKKRVMSSLAITGAIVLVALVLLWFGRQICDFVCDLVRAITRPTMVALSVASALGGLVFYLAKRRGRELEPGETDPYHPSKIDWKRTPVELAILFFTPGFLLSVLLGVIGYVYHSPSKTAFVIGAIFSAVGALLAFLVVAFMASVFCEIHS